MTTKQADKVIADRKPVTVRSKHFNETFTAVFVSRDRFSIRTVDGVYDRSDLTIVYSNER